MCVGYELRKGAMEGVEETSVDVEDREGHGVYALGKQKQGESAKKGNQLERGGHTGRGWRRADQSRCKDTYI